MNIVDKRNKLVKNSNKTYRRRAVSEIKNIAIHHSATTTGSAESFARYHVNNLNWPGIGYHYVVDKDGLISLCHDLDVVSYHVGNSNRNAVGICMVGDFRNQPLYSVQKKATMDLVQQLLKDLNLSIEDVWGHIEFPGYSWKLCPSIDMDVFRQDLKNGDDRTISVGEEIKPNRQVLRQGDRGSDVKELQQLLNNFGFNPGPIDGIFGPLTFDAVQKFQRSTNLTVDGIVGPKTKEALKSYKPEEQELIEQGSPTDEEEERADSITQDNRRILRFIRPMMKGNDVKEVQRKINTIVDGIFGPQTERKVREFQRKNNLVADGIVGPKTWNKLF